MESLFFEAFKKNWPVLLLLIYVVYEMRATRTDMSHEIKAVRQDMSHELKAVRQEIAHLGQQFENLGQKFETYKKDTDSKLNWLRDDQKEIRAELKTGQKPANR